MFEIMKKGKVYLTVNNFRGERVARQLLAMLHAYGHRDCSLWRNGECIVEAQKEEAIRCS
jgi:hypothetical protein